MRRGIILTAVTAVAAGLALAALWLSGVERDYAHSVTTGFGTVKCAHGTLPVPGPATLNLLEGVPTKERNERLIHLR